MRVELIMISLLPHLDRATELYYSAESTSVGRPDQGHISKVRLPHSAKLRLPRVSKTSCIRQSNPAQMQQWYTCPNPRP